MAWTTSMPLGSTSTTSAPKVVARLELVVLCPCAESPELAVMPTRFCNAFVLLSRPISEVSPELAFEAREFFSRPSGLQIEPGVSTSAACCARTRSM